MGNDFNPAKAVDLITFGRDEKTPEGIAGQITFLFKESYFRYHYLSKLMSTDRFRIVALQDTRVCGFCSVQSLNGYGVLSNLLVATSARGSGIAGLMEDLRQQICARENLIPYVSCVTVGMQSQRLKARRGMIPINVKFGYRRNVFRPGDLSSAVCFLGAGPLPPAAGMDTLKVDTEQKRIRIIAQDLAFLDRTLRGFGHEDSYYIDVLAAPGLPRRGLAERGLVAHGLDIEAGDRVWGSLWQVPNGVYRQGTAVHNDLIVPIEDIADLAVKWHLPGAAA
ncbi:MAG TPA: hypothetical protein VFR21_22860 [Bradyrhizobium sp.]|jgi:hypothetical protein|nr:hypothetical protein [Bradyrhizobium sp.]